MVDRPTYFWKSLEDGNNISSSIFLILPIFANIAVVLTVDPLVDVCFPFA